MPEITKLLRLPKTGRFLVFLDGRKSFTLSPEQVVTTKLKVGQDISDDAVAKLKKLSSSELIWNKVGNFLSFRPRSAFEVTRYLSQKGISEMESDTIITRLTRNGLLKDEDFATWWLDSRKTSRPRSLSLIRRELAAKGVAREIITKIIPTDNILDRQSLDKLLQVRLKRYSLPLGKEAKIKLINFLLRRGFAYPDIRSRLNCHCEPR